MTVVAATSPLLAFEVEVAAAVRRSPSFVRITLAGAALADFHPGGARGTRDQRVKLLLPASGGQRPQLSDLSPGWYTRWRAQAPTVRGFLRTYTVRRARLGRPDPQLDLDVVLHGGPSGSGPEGPGSTWAAAARVGDPVTLLGPNAHSDPVAGIEWQPPAASPVAPVRVLLAGDETAVPAISAVLESLPPGYTGRAVLEVPYADDVGDISSRADVEVTWLFRGRQPHGQLLRAAVADGLEQCPPGRRFDRAAPTSLPEVDIDAEILWDTPSYLGLAPGRRPQPFYAWIAGEAGTVRDLRRLLVTEHGVDRASVAFMGYWRQGRAEPT